MNSEQMDKMILEKLGGYTEDPSPDLFQSVLSAREQSKKNKQYTKILLVAAAVIALAVLIYVLMKVMGNDGQGSVLYPSPGPQVTSTGSSNANADQTWNNSSAFAADQNALEATAATDNNKENAALSSRQTTTASHKNQQNTAKNAAKNKLAQNASKAPFAAQGNNKPVPTPEQTKTLSLQAHFTYLVDSNGVVRFFNQSTHPEPARYEWSFSDGKTSADQDATHKFTSNGVYHVCLSVITESGRFDNDCQEVYIENLPTRKNIVGKVSAGGMIPERGWAYLIMYDSVLQTPYLIDSTKLDDVGYFAFGNLADGYYLVRATMERGSSMFKDYLPTYYGQTLVWNGANRYNTGVLTRKTSEMLVINMIPVHEHAKGDEVIRDNNTKPDPIGPKMMVLYDEAGNPIGFTYADNRGNYQFDNLPPGKYKVFDPATGRYTSYTKGPGTTPPADNTTPPASGSGKQTNEPGNNNPAPQQLVVSPNPCTQASSINIQFDNQELSYAHVTLVSSANGQVVREGKVQKPALKQNISFDVMYLPTGTYYVVVDKGNGNQMYATLIK